MRRLVLTVLVFLAVGPAAAQPTCEHAMAQFAKYWTEYDNQDKSAWPPDVKDNNERQRARERDNVLKGCAPGGFYDQVDEAVREVREQCAAHLETPGCR